MQVEDLNRGVLQQIQIHKSGRVGESDKGKFRKVQIAEATSFNTVPVRKAQQPIRKELY